MGTAYIRTLQPVGEYQLVEIIELGAGSPPPRPLPQPPLGIWGPTDPRPSHPIAGIPGFPGYTPPLPGGPGTPTPGPGEGMTAVVVPLPPSDPPATPPAGMPAGSSQVLIWLGPGTTPAKAWMEPYAAQHPTAPATPGSLSAKPK